MKLIHSEDIKMIQITLKVLISLSLLLASTHLTASAQQTNIKSVRLTRAQTKEAEQRLSDLGYWTGTVDGLFDIASKTALITFQKWEGRPVTSRLTLEELDAIRAGKTPTARETGYEHVEIDLDRQVLLIIDNDGGIRMLPVSTGSGQPFIDEGQTSVAYTPRGRFVVYDKVNGWD